MSDKSTLPVLKVRAMEGAVLHRMCIRSGLAQDAHE